MNRPNVEQRDALLYWAGMFHAADRANPNVSGAASVKDAVYAAMVLIALVNTVFDGDTEVIDDSLLSDPQQADLRTPIIPVPLPPTPAPGPADIKPAV